MAAAVSGQGAAFSVGAVVPLFPVPNPARLRPSINLAERRAVFGERGAGSRIDANTDHGRHQLVGGAEGMTLHAGSRLAAAT